MTAVINISPFNLHQTITLDNGEIIMCRMDEITSFAQKLIDEGAVTNFKVAGPEVFTQKIAKEISNIKPTKFSYISILYEKKGNLWESI